MGEGAGSGDMNVKRSCPCGDMGNLTCDIGPVKAHNLKKTLNKTSVNAYSVTHNAHCFIIQLPI